jgi:hypothetical protein
MEGFPDKPPSACRCLKLLPRASVPCPPLRPRPWRHPPGASRPHTPSADQAPQPAAGAACPGRQARDGSDEGGSPRPHSPVPPPTRRLIAPWKRARYGDDTATRPTPRPGGPRLPPRLVLSLSKCQRPRKPPRADTPTGSALESENGHDDRLAHRPADAGPAAGAIPTPKLRHPAPGPPVEATPCRCPRPGRQSLP